MRYSIFSLIVGLGLLGGVPARAELDEFAMTNWEMVASACAKYQQIFAAYGLENLFPDLKDRILGHAGDQDASEGQLTALERRFEAGRSDAVESGYTPGSRKDRVDKGRLEYLQSRAEQVGEICTRSYQSLALMGAQPLDDGGLDERAMEKWSSRAALCGGWQERTFSRGLQDIIPNMMAETLGNARGQGASDGQIEELAREYERGRAQELEEIRALEEKLGRKLDTKDETSRVRRDAWESQTSWIWKHCTSAKR